MTGILLAGGKSKRMGEDKAFLKFNGRALYEYPLTLLELFCDQILISSSDDRFRLTAYPVITDIIPDIGPVGGIFSCMKNSESERFLVLSCDTPFVTSEFVKLLVEKSENYHITIGENRQKLPEPLSGIYDKKLLDSMDRMIQREEYKMTMLLENSKANIINLVDNGLDPDKIFYNINSPADLKNTVRFE